MAKKVFYSFHYQPDAWRVSQVRNIGALDANQLLSDNAWEEVTSGGDQAIKTWIANQMSGRPCVVVLIGSATAGRKWVNYEIEKAWKDGRGVVGVYVHNLKNASGAQSSKGLNPLAYVTVDGVVLSSKAKAHDPPYSTSTNVYSHIQDNIEAWVDEAIAIRARN